jgi:DNA-binding response OmpR family regulator
MDGLKQKKILIVEDDILYRKMIGIRFKSQGYSVIMADNGLEGLNQLRNIKPDLVILDLMLPMMDGHKVCRLIKYDSRLQHIPVVILTARDMDRDADLAKKCGADAFIVKSTRSEIILDVVNQLLEKSHATFAGKED